MAWKTCPTCNEEIAHTANACPHCGHKFMSGCGGCLVFAAVVIVVLIFISC